MNNLKAIAATICVSITAFGAILMLIPEGKLQAQIKSLIGVLIVAIIASALSSGIGFDFSQIQVSAETVITQDTDNMITQQILTLAEEKLEKSIDSTLLKNGYENYEINIVMDISDNAGIFISKAEIYFNTDNQVKAEVVKGLIKKELDLEISVFS